MTIKPHIDYIIEQEVRNFEIGRQSGVEAGNKRAKSFFFRKALAASLKTKKRSTSGYRFACRRGPFRVLEYPPV